MNNLIEVLQSTVADAVQSLYGEAVSAASIQINPTPGDFTGDYSVVVFPFVKLAKKSPDAVAADIGAYIDQKLDVVCGYNVVKGFLNLSLDAAFWRRFLLETALKKDYGRQAPNGKRVMVEYSSPNTNKPLHLGHIRNILLGWSTAKLMEAMGYEVIKVQIINDRGVAICKSMVSWQLYGQGKTPENSGIKGDHLVGDFYVLFEQRNKAEYDAWQQTEVAQEIYREKGKAGESEKDFFKSYKNKWFNEYSEMGAAVREMLLRWENHDPAIIELWKQMNSWVYAGFDKTYRDLGVSFDKLYYESDTYLLGKEIVEEGVEKGVFVRRPDGSVIFDLTDIGQDQKVMLRSDGTSMYITQDLGTARMRYADIPCEKYVYVVASEQDYHFQVLFEALKRLGDTYADGLYHLSYGLVELPTGRMKTREGTVVDADDLIAEVIKIAREQAAERGEIEKFSAEAQEDLLRKIGMAALKFYIIKVHPHKKMIFKPEESVDLQGQTGPYVQYSYVRINGLRQRVEKEGVDLAPASDYADIQPQEKELLKALYEYPALIRQAAAEYDPSLVANFCYALAKSYHRFWHDLSVFNAPDAAARAFRLQLSAATGQVLQSAMSLLGIEMPEKM